MKYWMKFYDKKELVISLSDLEFMGKDLNIPKLKERWNDAFTKRLASAVEVSFLGNKVNKTFVAGYRDNKLVVIDTDTKQEYTPKEFSSNLNMIENILNGTKCLAV
jgi:hypothetical protein